MDLSLHMLTDLMFGFFSLGLAVDILHCSYFSRIVTFSSPKVFDKFDSLQTILSDIAP
jgi:hypothetical protein